MIASCPYCERPFTSGNAETKNGACELCIADEFPRDRRSQPRELDKNSYLPTADEIRAEAEKIRASWTENEELKRQGIDPRHALEIPCVENPLPKLTRYRRP